MAVWQKDWVLREGEWKLYYPENEKVHLYRVDRDPGEEHNVAQDEIFRAIDMSGRVKEYIGREPLLGQATEEILERLRAIGYVD